jgi:hypothetical protein
MLNSAEEKSFLQKIIYFAIFQKVTFVNTLGLRHPLILYVYLTILSFDYNAIENKM